MEKLEKYSFMCAEKKISGCTKKEALFMPWELLYMRGNWIQMIFCGKLVLACGKLS